MQKSIFRRKPAGFWPEWKPGREGKSERYIFWRDVYKRQAVQTAADAEKWIALMKQYVNPVELTAELLNLSLIHISPYFERKTGRKTHCPESMETGIRTVKNRVCRTVSAAQATPGGRFKPAVIFPDPATNKVVK